MSVWATHRDGPATYKEEEPMRLGRDRKRRKERPFLVGEYELIEEREGRGEVVEVAGGKVGRWGEK